MEPHEQDDWGDDRDFDRDRDECDRCGGEGSIEYDEAGPSEWGEDCPSEVNHLIECPKCGGAGYFEPPPCRGIGPANL